MEYAAIKSFNLVRNPLREVALMTFPNLAVIIEKAVSMLFLSFGHKPTNGFFVTCPLNFAEFYLASTRTA